MSGLKVNSLYDGRFETPTEPMKVVYTGERSLWVRCPCGGSFVAAVPPEGKRTEVLCPKGCGRGVEMDRRPEYGPPLVREALKVAVADRLHAEWMSRYFGMLDLVDMRGSSLTRELIEEAAEIIKRKP